MRKWLLRVLGAPTDYPTPDFTNPPDRVLEGTVAGIPVFWRNFADHEGWYVGLHRGERCLVTFRDESPTPREIVDALLDGYDWRTKLDAEYDGRVDLWTLERRETVDA
jgi:hypothetical protein